ncbi:MAG: hypothetical protein ACRDF7_09320, partial [Candidatus Limnocylindrales bacterium]
SDVARAAAGEAAVAAGAAAAAAAAVGGLPPSAWRAIKARVSLGTMTVELLENGRLLVAEVAYTA